MKVTANGVGRMNVDVSSLRKKNFDEITKINAHSASFDFLKDEPELYSAADINTRYA